MVISLLEEMTDIAITFTFNDNLLTSSHLRYDFDVDYDNRQQ